MTTTTSTITMKWRSSERIKYWCTTIWIAFCFFSCFGIMVFCGIFNPSNRVLWTYSLNILVVVGCCFFFFLFYLFCHCCAFIVWFSMLMDSRIARIESKETTKRPRAFFSSFLFNHTHIQAVYISREFQRCRFEKKIWQQRACMHKHTNKRIYVQIWPAFVWRIDRLHVNIHSVFFLA